ncbi:hypothetical protein C5167_003819 [Papaver somniferum]|uniref:Uncharacterized protein n=1 Tax=Papaver somniferum TaxID=3469 RepID=A0A4Y7L4M0_PAPSO|nr:hypothetical protein C5167_003819 [Papaver somniferum]
MDEVENQASRSGNGIKPKKYWGEESSTNPTTDPNAEVLNLRQQLENTVAEQQIAEIEAHVAHHGMGTGNTVNPSTELQAAMQRIAELEALVAHHGLGTANTVTPSTDAEIRNSP